MQRRRELPFETQNISTGHFQPNFHFESVLASLYKTLGFAFTCEEKIVCREDSRHGRIEITFSRFLKWIPGEMHFYIRPHLPPL